MDEVSLLRFVDAFRASVASSANVPIDGSHEFSGLNWKELLSQGLLQLKPATFDIPDEDLLPLDEQTQEQALRPYPSVRYHTLLAQSSQ
jgi:hypothetical protein